MNYYPRNALLSLGRSSLCLDGSRAPWQQWRCRRLAEAAHLITTYNQWLAPGALGAGRLFAYLFWGAEYWVQRRLNGAGHYLAAIKRILSQT